MYGKGNDCNDDGAGGVGAVGGAGRGRKMIGRKSVNLIVGWCGRFLFFVVPRQFSRVVPAEGEK